MKTIRLFFLISIPVIMLSCNSNPNRNRDKDNDVNESGMLSKEKEKRDVNTRTNAATPEQTNLLLQEIVMRISLRKQQAMA